MNITATPYRTTRPQFGGSRGKNSTKATATYDLSLHFHTVNELLEPAIKEYIKTAAKSEDEKAIQNAKSNAIEALFQLQPFINNTADKASYLRLIAEFEDAFPLTDEDIPIRQSLMGVYRAPKKEATQNPANGIPVGGGVNVFFNPTGVHANGQPSNNGGVTEERVIQLFQHFLAPGAKAPSGKTPRWKQWAYGGAATILTGVAGCFGYQWSQTPADKPLVPTEQSAVINDPSKTAEIPQGYNFKPPKKPEETDPLLRSLSGSPSNGLGGQTGQARSLDELMNKPAIKALDTLKKESKPADTTPDIIEIQKEYVWLSDGKSHRTPEPEGKINAFIKAQVNKALPKPYAATTPAKTLPPGSSSRKH